jgi:cytochrome c
MKTMKVLLLLLPLLLVLLLVACSGGPASPTGGNGQTAGQMAGAGQTVFADKCSPCHGDRGQGVSSPSVIGSGANLGKFNTGKGLYDYVKSNMPFNAPGSLSDQEYLNVVAFLLVQDNYVSSDTQLDTGKLESVNLKK